LWELARVRANTSNGVCQLCVARGLVFRLSAMPSSSCWLKTLRSVKLGIPLVPLVVLFGTGMLLIMWGGALVSWWIAIGVLASFAPALLWMRFVTSQDDQRFRQMFVAMKLRLHDRNRRFWHARSYSPTLYRGARDAWHV
jgi:type IV secretion system protein VirB3